MDIGVDNGTSQATTMIGSDVTGIGCACADTRVGVGVSAVAGKGKGKGSTVVSSVAVAMFAVVVAVGLTSGMMLEVCVGVRVVADAVNGQGPAGCAVKGQGPGPLLGLRGGEKWYR